MTSGRLNANVAGRTLLLGLLVLLLGREAIRLDRAQSVVLGAAALVRGTPDDVRARADWDAGRVRRAALARAAIAAGQALTLAGLVLSAWVGADGARWMWRALLAWWLLLLFAGDPAFPERLR